MRTDGGASSFGARPATEGRKIFNVCAVGATQGRKIFNPCAVGAAPAKATGALVSITGSALIARPVAASSFLTSTLPLAMIGWGDSGGRSITPQKS
jgi:hypothetical protein